MKRFWLGLGILAALLILGFWVQHSSKDLHKPVVDALKKAQSSAVAEDWEQTEKMVEQAEKHWHRTLCIGNISGKNIHRGRFAGTVWAQKTQYLTFLYTERNVIEGFNLAIPFR